ncbi:MAG: hypothetical protein Q7T55_01085, partial [Solirubrobacteraceae bacterium]|nr:hypothetical protein [Solirubrobacteraceae bacterium]
MRTKTTSWLLAAATTMTLSLAAAPAAEAKVGCYKPSGERLLRVLPKTMACRKGERRVQWSETGET